MEVCNTNVEIYDGSTPLRTPKFYIVYYHAYLWENPCGGLFSLAICVGTITLNE